MDLPDDVTFEEFQQLRMPPGGPARKPNIVRVGDPPIFREHGKARGRAHVVVNEGRWQLVCPTCMHFQPAYDQYGQRIVETVCGRCGNGAAGGRVFDVLWPTLRQQGYIEAILRCRPDPKTRNWHPGESLGMLACENVVHGCAVPELPMYVGAADMAAVRPGN